MKRKYPKKFWFLWLFVLFLILLVTITAPLVYFGSQINNSHRRVRTGDSYLIFNTDIVVTLTAERRRHIETKHPKVDLTDIHTALLWGDMEKDGCFRYYYGNKIKVVVKMINEDRGKIITAYYNSGGE